MFKIGDKLYELLEKDKVKIIETEIISVRELKYTEGLAYIYTTDRGKVNSACIDKCGSFFSTRENAINKRLRSLRESIDAIMSTDVLVEGYGDCDYNYDTSSIGWYVERVDMYRRLISETKELFNSPE